MRSRSIRTLAVLASAGMIVGAFAAGPADAAKKKKKGLTCATYAPAAPASNAPAAADAPKEAVLKVTPAHTEEAPLTVEVEQGQGLWIYEPDTEEIIKQVPVVDDSKFWNLQVYPSTPSTGLYVRTEWDSSAPDDLDQYIYNAAGEEIGGSGAFNAAPVPPISSTTGGPGFEQTSGLPVGQCEGVTVESRTYMTTGQTVTLKVWLGEEIAAEG